jgi:hypothetical protein
VITAQPVEYSLVLIYFILGRAARGLRPNKENERRKQSKESKAKKCWEMIAHAHIDADHRVMSHDGLFEKLLSVDTYTG